jgi:hypothetical protein
MLKNFVFFFTLLYSFHSPAAILQTARSEEQKASEEVASTSNITTKDDIARLMHLFKYPGAQVHWSNHYGVLNREQLDARRTSGPASDAANPLSCLAELFNDYAEFCPQNLMVAYVHDPAVGRPVKKSPWEASSEEWEELSVQTYNLEPTNLARHDIYRDAKWIKSTWNDVRKYLHQVFQQYNRSGQRSGDMGEWCSPEEQQRWVRAAFWKGGSTNTIVRFPTVMIYSIAVLQQGDFQGIARTMPEGTGIDNSVAQGDTSSQAKKRKKRGPYNTNKPKKSSPSNDAMLVALRQGTQTEAKLSALRLIMEFGTTTDKRKAMKKIGKMAYGKADKEQSDSDEQSEERSSAESDKASSDEEDVSSSSSD